MTDFVKNQYCHSLVLMMLRRRPLILSSAGIVYQHPDRKVKNVDANSVK